MSIVFHEQVVEMRRFLAKYGIRKLYHFTAIDNLSIIAKCGGLWSKQKSERAELLANRIITGGNELSLNLDRRYGNWDKIHLYFCPNTPMAYRVQQNFGGRDPQSAHICYLIIDPTVAMWKGVYFTDTNATENEHKREQGLDGLKLVNFRTIRAHLGKRWVEQKQQWHKNVQAECLVPNEIPLEYLRGVSFISSASLSEGERLWGRANHPPFDVSENLFHRGFPLTESYLLTSREVTKENVDIFQFQDEKGFYSKLTREITLIVYLQATAGSQAKAIWYDGDNVTISEDETEFERESGYWHHWPSLGIVGLEEGDYSVEYYLNGTRWFKTYFEIRG